MGKNDKREQLKEMIRELHSGVSPEKVKEKFKQFLKTLGPVEITRLEEELIKEGFSVDEIRRLCDVHLEVFKENIESLNLDVKPGHPIFILLKEHEYLKGVLQELKQLTPILAGSNSFDEIEWTKTEQLLGDLREYNQHKVREENCLFPYLEKYGVTQPPAIMWTEHDEQRTRIKKASLLLAEKDKSDFESTKQRIMDEINVLVELINNHFYKEEHILFYTALKLFSEASWTEIKAAMDDLGYCSFTPRSAIGEISKGPALQMEKRGRVVLDTGELTSHELEAILNTLPIDITFVDNENTVRYFNQTRERIFPRTKTVIGRKVQNCHPQKSLHLVERLLEEFRTGVRDMAEFRINLQGRFILIRYYAVRDAKGEYLGCLEVTQDITDIRNLSGEKRLL